MNFSWVASPLIQNEMLVTTEKFNEVMQWSLNYNFIFVTLYLILYGIVSLLFILWSWVHFFSSNKDFSAKGVVKGVCGGVALKTTPKADKLKFEKNRNPSLRFKYRDKVPNRIHELVKFAPNLK